MNDPVQAALEIAHTGAIQHDGPGRTDTIDMSVPEESFVVPADVVSSLGEGNTANGFKILNGMFPPSIGGGNSVPIVSAGGEFVISPQHVLAAGNGDLKRGHKALLAFVAKVRAKTIKTLQNLPKPVMK